MAERAAAGREALRRGLAAFAQPRGEERVLDAGTGSGALALAIAPLVGDVVGVDLSPKLLAHAREQAKDVANVSFEEADITALPYAGGSFDLVCCMKTLHHIARPEVVFAELVRVCRPGGGLLVIDQIAPGDPPLAADLDRFERARDSSHTRLLADVDIRSLYEANGLVVKRETFEREPRDLEWYLDLAGCTGAAREEARGLAPPGYTATVGWYLGVRPIPRSW